MASSSSLTAGLARKLKKVLEIRTDSPDLLVSLSTLSSFYSQNSAHSRKNLRSSIERRSLSINDEFLAASEAAQRALDVVEAEVRGLAECCDRIGRALSTSASSTGDMVVATERLRAELESALRKQELITNFLHNYQLTAEEIAALRDNEIDERFFAALARVHEIHSNCKMLLRTHHQRAGLELMDVMAVYQDAAYDRLCRWVQSECRQLGEGDTPEISPLLKAAAHSLKERPMLFKYCAEEVANTRHYALLPRFIAALTRGGPGGMPRPIEVHAHDPLRYVGDMLAWLHQALASERELAAALFGSDSAAGEAPRPSASPTPGSEAAVERGQGEAEREGTKEGEQGLEMAAVLDRVFEAVCRPFKVRVEQVLVAGHPGLVLSYKLCNLLAFYSHTFCGLLGPKAALSVVLSDLLEAAQRSLQDAIKARGDKLLRFPMPVPQDLSPPTAVPETMAIVVELIEAYNSMMVPAGVDRPDFSPILSGLLEPLTQMCERAAEMYGVKTTGRRFSTIGAVGGAAGSGVAASAGGDPLGLPAGSRPSPRRSSSDSSVSPEALEIARHIFLTNCLAAMHTALAPHAVAKAHEERLAEAIEAHMGAMVRKEVTLLLTRCQLTTIVALMAARASTPGQAAEGDPSLLPLAEQPATSAAAVADALRQLFGILAGGPDGQSGLPEFSALQVPRLRGEACGSVAVAVAEAYGVVYSAVVDPNNGYPDPRAMLRHTPEHMRTILGV